MTNTATTVATVTKRAVQELKDLKTAHTPLQQEAPFKPIGREMLAPVCVKGELGFTFGTKATDGYTYNDSIAGTYLEAAIDSNPCSLVSRFGYDAADRLKSKGKQALAGHVGLRIKQMKQSFEKMLEIEALRGRSSVGLGVVESVSDSSGTNTLTITLASWASSVFTGFSATTGGLQLDCYSPGGSKRNSNAALNMKSVTYSSRTVVVTGNTSDTAAIQAGDILYFEGAYAASQYGLLYQMETSGSVFGIDNSVYDLWAAQSQSAGSAALTMRTILQAAVKCYEIGGHEGDLDCHVSPGAFESLNSDLGALRATDSSYKSSRIEMGHSSIVYHSQFGKIKIKVHPYMPQGNAMLIPTGQLIRVGASDTTFNLHNGDEDGKVVQPLDTVAAYQSVIRAGWQIFLPCPAKACLITNIVNPT